MSLKLRSNKVSDLDPNAKFIRNNNIIFQNSNPLTGSKYSNNLQPFLTFDRLRSLNLSDRDRTFRDLNNYNYQFNKSNFIEENINYLQHQIFSQIPCSCPNCCEPLSTKFEFSDFKTSPINANNQYLFVEPIAADSITLQPDKINTLLLQTTYSTYYDQVAQINLDYKIDPWWYGNTITYSFYEDDVFQGKYYGTEKGVREVSEQVKNNVREILAGLETIINIDFVEVTETNTNTYGQIRYMLSNNPSYAYAYFPQTLTFLDSPEESYEFPTSGDIHLNVNYDRYGDTNGFQNQPGKHGYNTLIHETLHALGLKHPHDSNPKLASQQDNLTYTVMSYDLRGYVAPTYDNAPGTPMTYDVAALQYLYGGKENNTGNDVYVFGETTDRYVLNGKLFLDTPNAVKQTIWDSAGIDTLDFSNLGFVNSGYQFDLNGGGFLIDNNSYKQDSLGEVHYQRGTSIAFGVTIENLIASVSSDRIIANDAANFFTGYDYGVNVGNDIFVNTDRFDTLDLSSYTLAQVTQTVNNNDLVIGLNSFGSVTIQDYFATPLDNRLNIEFGKNQIIGEIGTIDSLDRNLQTIQLQGNYTNPVVFAQPLSNNEANPAIVRIAHIEGDSVSFFLQEPESEDGEHSPESFSYLVLEAGTWQLENGTVLEVGTLANKASNDFKWNKVDFATEFEETPIILSQVQTANNQEFIQTRQFKANQDSFRIALEKEELIKRSPYQEETIGWLAISSGEGDWDGHYYQADNTGDRVNHRWNQLNLSENFTQTPELLASLATYHGGDSAGLRYQEISAETGSTIQIKIEEDQSKDLEQSHTTEDINFFALQGTGLLTAEPYNPYPTDFDIIEDNLSLVIIH